MKHVLLILLLFASGFGLIPADVQASELDTGNCSGVFPPSTGVTAQQCADSAQTWATGVAPPPSCYGGDCTFFALSKWTYEPSVGMGQYRRLFGGNTFGTWVRTAVVECPAGTIEDEDGFCIDDPFDDPCPPGEVTGPGGICTSNPDPDEVPCKNVLGYVNGVEVCQDDRDECEALGGTYGIIMEEAGCLLDDEEPDLECESELFTFGNEYGGYVCVHPDPKNPGDDTPEPGVECPPGYTLAGDSCVIQDPNPGGDDDDDGTPNGEDDDDDGDGVPDARDPDRGAGQCDPTGIAYAECIGQLQQASSTAAEDIRNNANRDAFSTIDNFVKVSKGAIGDGDAGFVEPDGLVDEVTGLGIFSPGACTDMEASLPMGGSIEIKCSETQRLRDILFYIFPITTLFAIVGIAFDRREEKV